MLNTHYLGRYGVGDDGAVFEVGTQMRGLKSKLMTLAATVRTAVSAGGSLTVTVKKKSVDGSVTDVTSVTVTDAHTVGGKITASGGLLDDADEIQVAVSTAGGPAAGEVDLWAEFYAWTT